MRARRAGLRLSSCMWRINAIPLFCSSLKNNYHYTVIRQIVDRRSLTYKFYAIYSENSKGNLNETKVSDEQHETLTVIVVAWWAISSEVNLDESSVDESSIDESSLDESSEIFSN